MKELHGQAAETVGAPAGKCFTLLAAVDRYPLWYPDVVREVDVVGRDAQGQPTVARAKLRVSYGRLVHDFDLVLEVRLEEPVLVQLARVGGSQRFDLTWRVQEGPPTQIKLELDATLRVPRFVPLEGVGDTVARQFVTAAKSELASSS